MRPSYPTVFLVDVDNTLLDNDAIQQDLKDHIEGTFGVAARDRYWRILDDLFTELGYRDYIGALQRYRVEHPREVELLSMSSFLLDYPFADRLSVRPRGVGAAAQSWPDRDPVRRRYCLSAAQSRACRPADAVDGVVLIYIHKEQALDDVERRYPAEPTFSSMTNCASSQQSRKPGASA